MSPNDPALRTAPALLPDDIVPLVPMRNLVLFPQVLAPVTIGRPRSVAAVAQAAATRAPLAVVLQKNAEQDDPALADLCGVGTLASVMRQTRAEPGQIHVVCQGVQRVRVLALVEGHPFLAARIERLPEPDPETPPSAEAEALAMQLRERGAEILALLPSVPAEISQMLQGTMAPAQLADLAASLVDAEPALKQELLETDGLEERLKRVLGLVTHRLQVLRLSQEIGARTKEQFDDRQRRMLLQEQLRAIRKELGENGEQAQDFQRLEEAIAKAQMPPEADAQARKELQRLKRMGESGGEASMLRTWIEWMTELPWAEPAPLHIDLDAARATLEADHHGLPKVKRRIVEYLAVKKLNPTGRAPILCFAGPPGVGKTSLGQSIARALGRPFVRVSLGGVHDEAEIRGHRRTYIGALPGLVVQGLKRAGARDCVMMLDEVDKLGTSLRGDPAAALLEVLDPEQNATFRDHYLGLPFDLSRVVFIATANVIDNMPAPVRDRMEVIELPGYTLEEKLQIARHYLVQRQREACGLQPGQVELTDAALREIASHHTREAGVRQLEREIGRAMRHAAMRVAHGLGPQAASSPSPLAGEPASSPSPLAGEGLGRGGRSETPAPVPLSPSPSPARGEGSTSAAHGVIRIDAADLEPILGPAPYEHETALRAGLPGVATGLAWTAAGGDILFIEATRVPGSDKLILTGQLGDVMKESAQAALTLVKSRGPSIGIAGSAFEHMDLHLHVPAGAIPKDGPSAGVAMFIALASLFSNRPVRPDVAMTGEISLRGLVLPVGGIKEKVLAALRAGVRTVLLPARNRKDLVDVPEPARAQLEIIWLEQVDDALAAALGDRRQRVAEESLSV
jgi:ATP-dependent Lon protease